MIALIDNYDSFTFNIVHALQALQQDVVVYQHDKISVSELSFLNPQGIVLSPGPGRPEDAGISLQVLQRLPELCPILGVCLGHQCIAQHFGAQIISAEIVQHGSVSEIVHDGSGLFKGLPSKSFNATRYNSLTVDLDSLPKILELSAWSIGDNQIKEVMGLRHRHLPIEGVQFHPESVLSEFAAEIFTNFIQRCSR